MDISFLGFCLNMAIIWVVLAVIFAIIEAVTTSLTTIWFFFGALISAIFALFDASIVIQVVVFFVASIVLLLTTRPLLLKYCKPPKSLTNAGALIGQTALVTKEIRPLQGGEVQINGLTWIGIAKDPTLTFLVDSPVLVSEVRGAKLVVEPLKSS